MPRISEFFGITIFMYLMDTKKHHIPHFHARYSGNEAVFTLDGKLLAGHLGTRAERLVKEWAEERKTDLEYAWSQAVVGKEIPWIPPIK